MVFLKIFNDIAVAIDSGSATAVCLLELLAAFGMVDRGILLTGLKKT